MLISIVIPAHNAAATLGDCLGAVRGSDAFESLCREIIVVDDGSTDDTVDVAERHGATVVRLESAHGPGTARNRGAAKAVSEVVLFLDADVLVHPDTLTWAAAHFERDDGRDDALQILGPFQVQGCLDVFEGKYLHAITITSCWCPRTP